MSLVNALFRSFIDNSGDPVAPQLDASGRLPVTTGAAGTCREGQVSDGTGNTSLTDLVTVALTLNKVHTETEFMVGSIVETFWELVYIDDVGGTPAETIISRWFTGPGQFTKAHSFKCKTIDTNGGTGVQNLVLRYQQVELGCVEGYIATMEAP